MNKHTPGPWRRDSRNGIYELDIVGPHGEDIGYANYSDGADERTVYPGKANADLMAAAPELLEALKGILEIGKRDTTNSKYDGYYDSAERAIAKAEGR